MLQTPYFGMNINIGSHYSWLTEESLEGQYVIMDFLLHHLHDKWVSIYIDDYYAEIKNIISNQLLTVSLCKNDNTGTYHRVQFNYCKKVNFFKQLLRRFKKWRERKNILVW